MSDFDKEAEREKLREKYEQDQDDREVAERMSELLLQGATMTNAHCSECGDPIFRYDGQEFCATCERAVDRDRDGTDGGADTDEADIEVTAPSESRVAFGGGDGDGSARGGTTGAAAPSGAEGADDSTDPDQPDQSERASPDRPDRTEPDRRSRGRAGTADRPPAADPDPVADDLAAARETLAATLGRFARRAEATEDPQRARECLAAAREAAETLSALRR